MISVGIVSLTNQTKIWNLAVLSRGCQLLFLVYAVNFIGTILWKAMRVRPSKPAGKNELTQKKKKKTLYLW